MSLLCRIVRNGNPEIRLHCLSAIKKLSTKKNASIALVNSEHFKEVAESLLTSSNGNLHEKIYILQSLLSIAQTSESHRAKIKNSPWNRKLKDHLGEVQSKSKHLESAEEVQIHRLANLIDAILNM